MYSRWENELQDPRKVQKNKKKCTFRSESPPPPYEPSEQVRHAQKNYGKVSKPPLPNAHSDDMVAEDERSSASVLSKPVKMESITQMQSCVEEVQKLLEKTMNTGFEASEAWIRGLQVQRTWYLLCKTCVK